MAKAKSKKITIEDALVPVEEQPYEVPENWCWVRIGVINSYISASVDPAKDEDRIYELYSVPSSDNDFPEIVSGKNIGSTKQSVRCGDVLLCKINPRINRVWKVSQHTNNELLASSEWIVIRNDKICTEYLMYCLQSQYFRELMLSNVSGVGGSLMRAKPKNVMMYPIPLPPFPEQQRIVEQIESLFSKLDEAKEKVELVVDQYRDRRAALIHKAYVGELTSKWRYEKGVNKSSWETKQIKDIAKSLKYGTAKKSEENGKVIVIRMGNLQEGEIEWENLAYSNDADDIQKYNLEKGDVLFNRTNSPEWVGKTSIYRGEYPAIYAGYLIKIDYDRNVIDGEYLNYMLNSAEAKEYCNRVKTDGVNQSNINAQKIGAFVIPVPSIDEQREISRILYYLLKNEKQIMSIAESVMGQIDSLKKSILAKAFRGELGTNNPMEESTKELLKQIVNNNG